MCTVVKRTARRKVTNFTFILTLFSICTYYMHQVIAFFTAQGTLNFLRIFCFKNNSLWISNLDFLFVFVVPSETNLIETKKYWRVTAMMLLYLWIVSLFLSNRIFERRTTISADGRHTFLFKTSFSLIRIQFNMKIYIFFKFSWGMIVQFFTVLFVDLMETHHIIWSSDIVTTHSDF